MEIFDNMASVSLILFILFQDLLFLLLKLAIFELRFVDVFRRFIFHTLDFRFLPSLQVFFPEELPEAVSAFCFLRRVVCSVIIPRDRAAILLTVIITISVRLMHACMHVLELTVK